MYKWITANHITINPKKSHCVMIPPKNTNSIPNLAINLINSLLVINESEIYLRITIDYRLNFEDQIKLLTAKISTSLSITYKLLRHILPVAVLRNLSYSMIYPHLLYKIVT